MGFSNIKKPVLLGTLGSASGAGMWFVTAPQSEKQPEMTLTTDILESVKEQKDPTKTKWEQAIALIREKITVQKLKSTATGNRVVTEGQYLMPDLTDETKWGNIQGALNNSKNKSKVNNRSFSSVEEAQRFCLEDLKWQSEVTLIHLTNEETVESLCIWDVRKDPNRSRTQ
ncbi:hypothetical protein MHF_0968 [Mycoplasma haemofelis Ohio2]|uniref:Uncharacterized protein n=1 Tax=Mycoplasma haemofelis (strain Ohio2) TaxID=859194 RepID=F6FJ25_MYCHI|nr:hypothetical protein MHF_0968 [Mycoplasma haemofelis Ohio2]